MLLSINAEIIDKPLHTKGFNKPFVPCDLSADGLIDHIKRGHAFSAQFLGQRRKADNFAVSGFLAVDIDKGLTVGEALALPYVQQFASIIYTTASHTENHHRFRIVFELEEPITESKAYRSALTALIFKFGGDRACKDSARMFFGCRDTEVHKIGKVLPTTQVDALIAKGTKHKIQNDQLLAKHASAVRTQAPFGMDQLVKRADGTEVPLSAITPQDRSIHCPFHVDRRPSAFVVFSGTGVGIYCRACGEQAWVQRPEKVIRFDWHASYQAQAEEHFHGHLDDEGPTTESCLAEDGTRIWLYDSRHLPKLSLMPGLTYIRSPKGSGKTEQLAEIVKDLRAQGKSILLIGHRRLLLKNLAKRIGIPFYLGPNIHHEIEATKCLAVSMESLPLFVDPKFQFDAVIIDESEQVVAHFTSSTLAHNRAQVRALLELLVLRASHIICADADIGLLTAAYFYLTRQQDHPDNLILNTYRTRKATETSGQGTSTVDLYEDVMSLLAQLEDDVRSGKRCFVATNSIRQAELIEHNLRLRYPKLSFLLITSKTSDAKATKAFTANPSKEAFNYDAIICSPALSTGVDISFANGARHIDSVYGVFKDGITTHFDIDQQLARVRNPGSVRVWISPRRVALEHDPHAIYEEMIRGRDAANFINGYTMAGEPVWADNAMLEMIAWILSIRRASLSNLRGNFVSLKKQNGWTVQEVAHETRLDWQRRVPTDMQTVARICDARDPSNLELNWINSRTPFLGLMPDAIYIKRKHELRQRYGVKHVTPDLVMLDDDGRFQSKFQNLCFLYFDKGDTCKGDIKDQHDRLISSFDWTNGLRKKQLIESLLVAAGLYEVGAGFRFDSEVTAESLQTFAKTVARLAKDLESLLGIKVRQDVYTKPNIQLRAILEAVGMTLAPKRREIRQRVATDYYRIDLKHWEHVIKTVGIEEHLLVRQHLTMQVDIEMPEPASIRTGVAKGSFAAAHPRDIRWSTRRKRK